MILAATLLLLAAQAPDSPSTAAPWRELGAARGYRMLYDPAVARSGETVTARLMTRIPGARETDAAYVVATVEIRCSAGEARVTRATNRRADHSLVRDFVDPLQFEAIAANSLMADLRQAVC